MMSHDEHDENYEGHEEHEEGEYHFSDDQVSYEMETEAPKTVAPTQDVKSNIVAKIKQYRRLLIGLSVFFILVFVVYKMMPNAATPPAAEFSQNQAPATQATPKSPAVVAQQQPPSAPQTTQAPVQPPAAQTQPAATEGGAEVSDRLGSLEQQNSKMMNMMESEYAQRMAAYEAQTKDMQGKLDTLTTRIASLETSLNQVTQLLQGVAAKTTTSSVSSVTLRQPEGYPPVTPRAATGPKIAYTVQAIIPGRAWLRSDNGDTITVAEGDMLKSYGKITKIDPYDGTVEVDTGTRLVSLSYGINGG
ncbi:hypothetical protein AYO45_04545 [Gammaproteobacteria bacterium SCGC AG-212-F23]|nr:hypothetical protein AYO45_04545 [Gammaproteobacteria bacterium SCGC AG-212-F23]